MNKYFPHDCNARSDERIIALRIQHGWTGYGLYFALIEKLCDSVCYSLKADYNLLAYDLRSDASLVKSVICDFGLFAFTEDGECFYSESLNRRMEPLDAKSKRAQEAAKKRWGNKSSSEGSSKESVDRQDTNAMNHRMQKMIFLNFRLWIFPEKQSKKRRKMQMQCKCIRNRMQKTRFCIPKSMQIR